MAQHTAGPWHYAQFTDGDNAITGPNGDERIAEMVTNEPDDVRDANARLIAAAPEMRELIEKFCRAENMIDDAYYAAIAACEREAGALLARINSGDMATEREAGE